MKIIVSKTAIEEAVKHLGRVISSKVALPVLNNIYCQVSTETNTMRMVSSDSEVWLDFEVVLEECDCSGEFCVPAKRMADALAAISEQPITITTHDDDNSLTITHATGETTFPYCEAGEFPLPIANYDTTPTEIPADILRDGINNVIFAVASDPLRPVMGCVHLEVMKKATDIVASNGHNLMRNRNVFAEEQTPFDLNIQSKVSNILARLMKSYGEQDSIAISKNAEQAEFKYARWKLTYRLLDYKYPLYKAVIPKECAHHAIVYPLALINSVKRVAPFANDSSNMIRLEFKPESITVSGEDFDFSVSASDTIEAECDVKKTTTIGVKASSLLTIVNKMVCSKLKLSFNDPSRPIIFEDANQDSTINGGLLGLAMPMIIND